MYVCVCIYIYIYIVVFPFTPVPRWKWLKSSKRYTSCNPFASEFTFTFHSFFICKFLHVWFLCLRGYVYWMNNFYNLSLLRPFIYVCLVTQLCLTLCDPVDYSSPRSSVHGDSPGNNTGVGCHGFLQGIFPTQGSNIYILAFIKSFILFRWVEFFSVMLLELYFWKWDS